MSIDFNGTTSRIALPTGFFDYERTQAFSISAVVRYEFARSGGLAGYQIFSRLNSSAPHNGVEFGMYWTGAGVPPDSSAVMFCYIANNFSSNRINVNSLTDIASGSDKVMTLTYDGSSTAAGVKFYLDGVVQSKNTVADNLSASILLSTTPHIGSRGTASFFNGQLSSFGAWSAQLNAAECASLGKFISPKKIRPQSLVMHAPLIREVIDAKGNALTATSLSVGANQPRIYL